MKNKTLSIQEKNALQQFARGEVNDPNDTIKKGCLIYTRVSTKAQHDSNHSLETQLEAILKYVKTNNLEIIEQFGQTWESAKTDTERQEFQRMIKYAKKHKDTVGQILVLSFDRWSRSGVSGAYLAAELKKLGIHLVSVSQPTDSFSASGTLMQNILLMFSEHDNSIRREKCISGTIARLERGYSSGTPPTGYSVARIDGEKSVAPNKQAKLIKKIFELKVYENKSNIEIAQTVIPLGLKVYERSIGRILSNPFYAGYITNKLLNGRVIKGKYEPIVSERLFLEANKDRHQMTFRTKKAELNPQLPLKNFVWCEHCNRGYMTGYKMKKRGIWYYKCSRKNCKNNRRAEILHDRFMELLSKYSISEDMKVRLTEQLRVVFEESNEDSLQEQDYLKTKIKEVRTKMERVEEKFIDNEITKDVYNKFHIKLESEANELEKRHSQLGGNKKSNIENFVKQALELSSNLLKIWELGDIQVRVQLQQLLFPEGISYHRQKDRSRTISVNETIFVISKLSEGYKNKKGDFLRNQADLLKKSPQVELPRVELGSELE